MGWKPKEGGGLPASVSLHTNVAVVAGVGHSCKSSGGGAVPACSCGGSQKQQLRREVHPQMQAREHQPGP